MKTFGQFLESTAYDSDRADDSMGAMGQIWNLFRDGSGSFFDKIMELLDLHGAELAQPMPAGFHSSWRSGNGSSLATIMAIAVSQIWHQDSLNDRDRAELIGKLLDMESGYPVTPYERYCFQRTIGRVEPKVRATNPRLAEKLVAASLAAELER